MGCSLAGCPLQPGSLTPLLCGNSYCVNPFTAMIYMQITSTCKRLIKRVKGANHEDSAQGPNSEPATPGWAHSSRKDCLPPPPHPLLFFCSQHTSLPTCTSYDTEELASCWVLWIGLMLGPVNSETVECALGLQRLRTTGLKQVLVSSVFQKLSGFSYQYGTNSHLK